MKRLILLVGLLFSLCACAGGPTPPKLPYQSWYVGLAAPRFMEVWVESVDVLDQRGLAFFHVSGGVVSYTGKAEGWHQGAGSTMPVNNVDLPDRIFVRWQSLVEPQTYKIGIRMVRNSPRARAGLSRFAASAPPAWLPAPIRVWASSMNSRTGVSDC
ncbi:exported hypothetical protein [Pseudomonas sp. IT-P258]